jgi:hypothetical protein
VPNSPNFSGGKSSTAVLLQKLNGLNAGTTPARPA